MLLVVYPALSPFLESHNAVERGGAIGGLVGGGGAASSALAAVSRGFIYRSG